jgi:hypothetical protein
MRAFKREATAVETIKGEAGYSGDGLSVFTHRASRSKQPRSADARPPTVRSVIETEERKLRKLYAEHRAGISDPVKLLKVQKNIHIAQTFIVKLYAELGAAMRKGRA